MKKLTYRFDALDYCIFAFMLLVSALTGIYLAWRSKSQRHLPHRLKDYLTGNQTLRVFPVGMSLIASYISGVTMVGTPAEIYYYGTQYWMVVFAMSLSGLCVATVYLPVFVKLEVCSSYEYLEMRFNKSLRVIASLCFLLDEIMFLPMLLYVPSLAFSQVSDVDLHIISVIVCAVCVFYTYLGGLRAVVYTDTWQTVLMFISIVVVVIMGTVDVGSINLIFKRASEGGRLIWFNFDPSMYERYTMFSVLIGGFLYWTSFNAVNQTMVQRYLSLPSLKKSKISVLLFTIGVVCFISLCCYSGLLLYATYYKCDPMMSNRVKASDQILPLFVTETAEHKGIPGLFIAGVFGAALSSLSVVLNSTAIVLLEDFFRGVFHINLSERTATIVTKIIIVVLGILACALVFVIESIGAGVFEIATTFAAIAAGTMFGVFSLGMLVPWANTKGAVVGVFVGFVVIATTAYGRQIELFRRRVASHKLPGSIEQCEATYGIKNLTASVEKYPDESQVFGLFRVSYLWITPIGFVTIMTVGTIVSFLTGKTDIRYIDPHLISPVSQWLLPKEAQNYAGTAMEKIKHQRLLGNEQGLSNSNGTEVTNVADHTRLNN